MPEEERISPAVVIIPIGIGLGLAAVMGVAALAWAAPKLLLEITWKRHEGVDVWHSISEPMPKSTDIIHRFKIRNTGDITTSFKVGYYVTDYGAGWRYSNPIDINPNEEGYIDWVLWTGGAGTYTTTWYLFGDGIEVDSMTVTTIVS